MNKLRKGTESIVTMTARSAQVFLPYKAYMRITVLEMEKARRGAEREAAMSRVHQIEDRLAWIETEKAALVAALNGHGTHGTALAPEADAAVMSPSAMASASEQGGGFRHRY